MYDALPKIAVNISSFALARQSSMYAQLTPIPSAGIMHSAPDLPVSQLVEFYAQSIGIVYHQSKVFRCLPFSSLLSGTVSKVTHCYLIASFYASAQVQFDDRYTIKHPS